MLHGVLYLTDAWCLEGVRLHGPPGIAHTRACEPFAGKASIRAAGAAGIVGVAGISSLAQAGVDAGGAVGERSAAGPTTCRVRTIAV